jgi:hypothetical protein
MTKEQKTAFIAELDAMTQKQRHAFLDNLIRTEQNKRDLRLKLLAILDNFQFSFSRELFIDTNGNHERVVDLILKGKVEPGQSLEPGQSGVVFRYAFENPMKEHYYESDSVLLDRVLGWLDDIAECSGKITSGNASHMGMTVKGKALRSIEFINKHRMK